MSFSECKRTLSAASYYNFNYVHNCAYKGRSLFLNILMPSPYITIAITIRAINCGIYDSPLIILSESNRVNIVKFFKKRVFSPTSEIICMTRKITGSPAPTINELLVSLNRQEAKNPIPVTAKYSSKAPRLRSRKVLTSSSPGKLTLLRTMPTIVTIPIIIVILIIMNRA